MHPEQAPLDGERQHVVGLLQQPRHLPGARLLGRNISSRAGGHQALGETNGIQDLKTQSFGRDSDVQNILFVFYGRGHRAVGEAQK